MLIRYTLLISFMCSLVSCSKVSHHYTPTKSSFTKTETNTLFMGFSIEDDSLKQKALVTLLFKKEVEGSAKNLTGAPSISEDKLIFTQLTRNQEVVEATEVEHPLIRELEYMDSQGRLEMGKAFLGQAEFFVRLLVTRATAFIQIDEFRNGKKITLLTLER